MIDAMKDCEFEGEVAVDRLNDYKPIDIDEYDWAVGSKLRYSLSCTVNKAKLYGIKSYVLLSNGSDDVSAKSFEKVVERLCRKNNINVVTCDCTNFSWDEWIEMMEYHGANSDCVGFVQCLPLPEQLLGIAEIDNIEGFPEDLDGFFTAVEDRVPVSIAQGAVDFVEKQGFPLAEIKLGIIGRGYVGTGLRMCLESYLKEQGLSEALIEERIVVCHSETEDVVKSLEPCRFVFLASSKNPLFRAGELSKNVIDLGYGVDEDDNFCGNLSFKAVQEMKKAGNYVTTAWDGTGKLFEIEFMRRLERVISKMF